MQYRPYGKLGYDVSLLGMGCMRLPRRTLADGTVEIDREKAIEIIQYAADHGVNYFDTAYSYHVKMSEAVLGEALDGGYRKRVKVVTKQPFPVMKTKDNMRRNLEQTLTKLRTDYLDVYLVHNIGAKSWPEIQAFGVLEEYEKYKSEGLIRAIGFSYHGQYPGFHEVLNGYDWDMCQVQQNLLDSGREVTEQGIFDAGKKGCALVIMEPLRGGGLASAPREVRTLYDAYPVKRTPAEWAFRYMYNYPQVSCILSGMTTLEQLKENLETFSAPDAVANVMAPDEKKLIANVKAAYETRVTIPCTACEYCLPCPNGVGIPAIFKNYNAAKMFENYDNPRRSYMLARRRGSDASHCTECHACETKCPQGIAIADRLKEAHELLLGWEE